jgi:16S rRNA (guanine527-N7)-methyltransferase
VPEAVAPAGSPAPADEPAIAAEVFGPALGPVRAYAALLAGPAAERGLIGPREVGRLWTRHLLASAVISELVPTGVRLVDLGSGAGLPGLVLALARPDLDVVLVERMARRVRFLTEALAELSLSNASVVAGTAEEVAGRVAGDVVVARALAPLAALLPLAVPLCVAGGRILAVKGARVAEEIAAATAVIQRLHLAPPEICRAGVGVVDPPVTVVRVSVPQRRPAEPRRPPSRRSRR